MAPTDTGKKKYAPPAAPRVIATAADAKNGIHINYPGDGNFDYSSVPPD
jgi:hypothetical protein